MCQYWNFFKTVQTKALQLAPLRCSWLHWGFFWRDQFLQNLWSQDFLRHLLDRSRPAPAEHFPKWDLSVLQAFTMERSQLRNLFFYPDRSILKTDPGFLPKVATVHNRSQEIILPTFCSNPLGGKRKSSHNLDVRRILLRYLEVTRDFRSSDSVCSLFWQQKGTPSIKGVNC